GNFISRAKNQLDLSFQKNRSYSWSGVNDLHSARVKVDVDQINTTPMREEENHITSTEESMVLSFDNMEDDLNHPIGDESLLSQIFSETPGLTYKQECQLRGDSLVEASK